MVYSFSLGNTQFASFTEICSPCWPIFFSMFPFLFFSTPFIHLHWTQYHTCLFHNCPADRFIVLHHLQPFLIHVTDRYLPREYSSYMFVSISPLSAYLLVTAYNLNEAYLAWDAGFTICSAANREMRLSSMYSSTAGSTSIDYPRIWSCWTSAFKGQLV